MNAEARAAITVVICTKNRADSLRETLACLARAEVPGLHSEIVVVDNGGSDATAEVVRNAPTRRPVRYLLEPHPGKGWALNRALSAAPLGEIVAVLDDDMSPHADWFEGVKAICDRWPGHDLFTGRSYVIWPHTDIPTWCKHPALLGWAFSVMGDSRRDVPLAAGRWFSGNHFWFRSRVLADGRRFDSGKFSRETHIEMAEPQFMLQLIEDGYSGVMAPDAVCGHRIQLDLLQPGMLRIRAVRCGRTFSEVRLRPFRSSITQARLLHQHPVISRAFCVWRLFKWTVIKLTARFRIRPDSRIAWVLQSHMEIAYYTGLLTVSSQMSEYHGLTQLRK